MEDVEAFLEVACTSPKDSSSLQGISKPVLSCRGRTVLARACVLSGLCNVLRNSSVQKCERSVLHQVSTERAAYVCFQG